MSDSPWVVTICCGFALLAIIISGWCCLDALQRADRRRRHTALAAADRQRLANENALSTLNSVLESGRQPSDGGVVQPPGEPAVGAPAGIRTINGNPVDSAVWTLDNYVHRSGTQRAAGDHAGLNESTTQDIDINNIVAEMRRQNRSYSLPNMRLPKINKSAFHSYDLFRQQQDATTYDAGLQHFLESLQSIFTVLFERPDPLSTYDFIVNFSGAVSPEMKCYSIRMKYPDECTIQLKQQITPELQVRWDVVHHGRNYTFQRGLAAALGLVATVPVPPEPTPLPENTADEIYYARRGPREITFD